MSDARKTFLTIFKDAALRKMALRSRYWDGPGAPATTSEPFAVPASIPDSFVMDLTEWLNNFNEQCIAAGHSDQAQVRLEERPDGQFELVTTS